MDQPRKGSFINREKAHAREADRLGLGFKQKTLLLKEAEGESSLVVKPRSDAMPSREEAGDRYRLDGDIARGRDSTPVGRGLG
jgi:hypothetical protein